MKILKKGHAIAFDFDGVIHKYSKGWQDGSIYDEANWEVVKLIILLASNGYPVFILSTRDPKQIEEWWNKQGWLLRAKVIDPDVTFYNNWAYIGVTNRKLPAQLYIDDRAYSYTDQSAEDFIKEFNLFND